MCFDFYDWLVCFAHFVKCDTTFNAGIIVINSQDSHSPPFLKLDHDTLSLPVCSPRLFHLTNVCKKLKHLTAATTLESQGVLALVLVTRCFLSGLAAFAFCISKGEKKRQSGSKSAFANCQNTNEVQAGVVFLASRLLCW